MHNLLKQFEGKDSASFDKRFNRSLFFLTLFYSIILGLILLFSASITYSAFSNRIGPRFEHSPVFNNQQVELIVLDRRGPTAEEVRDDLFSALIVINGFIFVLAIVISYFLARLTLRPLKQSYREQRRFIADASHELRTPLAIMHAELENELAGLPQSHSGGSNSGANSSRREKIESHLEEVNRMTKIVQDMLTLSKLESRHANVEIKPVDIIDVAKQTIKRLQSLAEKHDVKIIFNDHDKIGASAILVQGNEQVSHILMNVIQNAILYNKPQGTVDISIIPNDESVGSLGQFASVVVKDTGIGISSHDLEHIFDRFYRVDKSRSRATGGNGLGMSIVQRGVEMLGGKISIDSKIGDGTIVKISFKKV